MVALHVEKFVPYCLSRTFKNSYILKSGSAVQWNILFIQFASRGNQQRALKEDEQIPFKSVAKEIFEYILSSSCDSCEQRRVEAVKLNICVFELKGEITDAYS